MSDNNSINSVFLEKRRVSRLKAQEKNRANLLDKHRRVVEKIKRTPRSSRDRTKKSGVHNLIMFSEWLIRPPDEIESEWLFKLCPVGRRCILQAVNGETKAYDKRGSYLMDPDKSKLWPFISHLPGGGATHPTSLTILDCIYSEVTKTFFVIDALHWKDQPLVDMEMDCRQFYLESRFDDLPPSDDDVEYKIKLVKTFPCNLGALEMRLLEYHSKPAVDGLLFYHRKAHYTSGSTPLVLWLKPFMIYEVFGACIADDYYKDRPDDYITYEDFIRKYNEREAKMAAKRRQCSLRDVDMTEVEDQMRVSLVGSMEAEDAEDEENDDEMGDSLIAVELDKLLN